MSLLPLPWQHAAWQRLVARVERLPHALLVTGPAGSGVAEFASAFAGWLLCGKPESQGACGRCQSCRLFAAGSHPDFRRLKPAEAEEHAQGGGGGHSIGVDEVRALADFLALTSQLGKRRVVLIAPAEAMNVPAANALLKMLEEPGPETVFLLASHIPRALLPTVVSRCQRVSLPMPTTEQAVAWLQAQDVATPELCLAMTGGAPLAAREWAIEGQIAARAAFLAALADPARLDWLKLAEEGARGDLTRQLDWLQKWTYDLVALRLTGRLRYNPDFAPRLQELEERANLTALLAYVRRLENARRFARHPLNTQLLLETLFSEYQKILLPDHG